ncbi:MAG: hypothetical protein IKN81_00700 [Oscillospiraceae bacterium]|nr:hypothetical protein [Oscillospiraceae bacterium]
MKLKNIFRGFGRKKKTNKPSAPPVVEKADPNAWPEPDVPDMDSGEAWPEPDEGGAAEAWPDEGGGTAEAWPDTGESWPDEDASTAEATAWPDADAVTGAEESSGWSDSGAADAGDAGAWPAESQTEGENAWPQGDAATPEPPAGEAEDGKKGKKKKKPKKEKKKKKKKGDDTGEEGKKKKPKLLLILIPVVVVAAAAAVLLILKPWAPKAPKEEEPEIVEEQPPEEPAEEEPAVEATAANLTPAQPPVMDTAGAMDRFASLDPGSLGLAGESMAEYRYYSTGKTITVDGIRCREIMVYSVSESAGTNNVEGRYFLSMDGQKLFRDTGDHGVEELSPSTIGIGD